MIHVAPVSSPDELQTLKAEYIRKATAPLDGMWLCGFVPQARHYRFSVDSAPVGYCCVNDEAYLLQWYVRPSHAGDASALLGALIEGAHPEVETIAGAYASTAEPDYLALCREHFPRADVHTLMYEFDAAATAAKSEPDDCKLCVVEPASLEQVLAFCLANVDGPADWQRPYLSDLIERGELYACRRGEALIGTGESRGHREFQPEYGDLGVIVAEDERGKGYATWILRQLVERTLAKDLQPICSTTVVNVGAQRAIERAGFVSRHRILQLRCQ